MEFYVKPTTLNPEPIRPRRSVGAGRAMGGCSTACSTLANMLAKTSSFHIALLGGYFWSPGVLRFAVLAMGISFWRTYF